MRVVPDWAATPDAVASLATPKSGVKSRKVTTESVYKSVNASKITPLVEGLTAKGHARSTQQQWALTDRHRRWVDYIVLDRQRRASLDRLQHYPCRQYAPARSAAQAHRNNTVVTMKLPGGFPPPPGVYIRIILKLGWRVPS